MRSEYINLNGYKKFIFDETNGKCIYCDVEETVEHFLINCSGSKSDFANFYNENELDYDIIRMKFKQSLRKTSIFFEEEKNFNIINILFPQVWQKIPKKTNPAFREIKEKNLEREIQIFKYVVQFVQDTRRFKKEKYCF